MAKRHPTADELHSLVLAAESGVVWLSGTSKRKDYFPPGTEIPDMADVAKLAAMAVDAMNAGLLRYNAFEGTHVLHVD